MTKQSEALNSLATAKHSIEQLSEGNAGHSIAGLSYGKAKRGTHSDGKAWP